MLGDFVLVCLLCLLIGAAVAWAFAQGVLRAQRILAAETLAQRLDEQAVLHALSLEAVRRGMDIVQADENAWQLLTRLREAKLPAPGVLPMGRMRMVLPEQRHQGGGKA